MSENITAFKRGGTFSFVFDIPPEIPNGFFRSWVPSAQLRKHKNSSPSGLIAVLGCFWMDPSTTRRLVMHASLTKDWPLGIADMDCLLTSSSGEKRQSTTAHFAIERGITT